MNTEIDKIVVKGVTYVPENMVQAQAPLHDGLEYVIVRTYSAGVHIGYLKSREGKECVLVNARRIYYWEGANTLSDVANIGTVSPVRCKITAPVLSVILTEAIEITPITQKAYLVLNSIPNWTKSND
jgi:hypothetical protein